MIDVIDLIPSADMRAALSESGREFSDMEKATIIANVGLSPLRRRELLQGLANETQDEALREQLQFSLDKEQRLIDRFRNDVEGYVYGVQLEDEEYPEDESIEAYFTTFAVAFDFGQSQRTPFWVRKWRVHQELPDGRQHGLDSSRGSLKFDAAGELELVNVWDAADSEGQWWPNIMCGQWPHFLFFEDRWLDLPDLYEQGDIVRVLGNKASYIDPAYDWAVVSVDRDGWEEYRAKITRWLHEVESRERETEGALADYSDMQITVEFPCKDGTFSHDHINPMFLEKVTSEAEGDEAELRQMATWAARGECGLEWISTVLKKRLSSDGA